LDKSYERQQMTMRRYRTQEVAGSSPASSMQKPGQASSLDFRQRSE
jgi:hypothetical protein